MDSVFATACGSLDCVFGPRGTTEQCCVLWTKGARVKVQTTECIMDQGARVKVQTTECIMDQGCSGEGTNY